jgi:hypothetical protein
MEAVVSDRRPYWKQRYDDKVAAGICTRGACTTPAVTGQTLCEQHRTSSNNTQQRTAYRRKTMEERKRERLPDERAGVTIKFTVLATKAIDEKTGVGEIEEVRGYFQTGEYDDGRLGEIFIKLGKPGENTALFDQWATMVSIALQYGAGVEELLSKARSTRFEPAGRVIGVKGVDNCSSLIDLVAQWAITRYANRTRGRIHG